MDKSNQSFPSKITCDEVKETYEKIKDIIVRTNCVKSHLDETTGMEVYLKQEFAQHTGSFKLRGALNVLFRLTPEQRLKGVITYSSGNFGQGLCYAGAKFGVPVTVVMPKTAPLIKRQKCEKYGGNVIVEGNNVTETNEHMLKLAKERQLILINSFADRHLTQGSGTVALEILEQVPDVDAIIVPRGSCSLLIGIGAIIKELKPHCQIIAVEAEAVPLLSKSIEIGKAITLNDRRTIADGLTAPFMTTDTFEACKEIVSKVLTVTEAELIEAILKLIEVDNCVVEASGAASVAALLSGKLNYLKGQKIVCILTGGNIDTTLLNRTLERALVLDGRLVKVTVFLDDTPEALGQLLKIIGNIGVNVTQLYQERAWLVNEVKLVCETRDYDHVLELHELIKSNYKAELHQYPRGIK